MALKYVDGNLKIWNVAGQGAKGLSAYDQARVGGFKGTEQQFNQALSKITEYQTSSQVDTKITNVVGDINNALDTINGEVI